jgi:hypothetical protein
MSCPPEGYSDTGPLSFARETEKYNSLKVYGYGKIIISILYLTLDVFSI